MSPKYSAHGGLWHAATWSMGSIPPPNYRWKQQLDQHGPEILRPGNDGCHE
jgi:hypothetical protein